MTEAAILAAALEIHDPAQRAAFLDQVCGGDAELRERLEESLRARERPGGPPERGPVSETEDSAAAETRSRAAGRRGAGRRPGQGREAPRRDRRGFNTYSQLGEVLFNQKKYAEAEPLVLQGYAGLRSRESKLPARARKRIAQAARRIVELYEKWGKPEKADEWRKKLE